MTCGTWKRGKSGKTCPAVGNPWPTPVNAVAVSPDGRLLAAASQQPRIYHLGPTESGPPIPANNAAGRRRGVLWPSPTAGRRGRLHRRVRFHCWEVTGLKEVSPANGVGQSAVVKKIAPPSAAQVAGGLEEMRKQFPVDYTHLDDEEDYHDLAVKRLNGARRAADQPFQCYVLYWEARDLAALSDEPALGLRIAEEMGRSYDFDVRSAKVEVLRNAGASNRRPAAARAFLDTAIPLIKTACGN